jgi:tetratricopeptide (TPR) repeat protein
LDKSLYLLEIEIEQLKRRLEIDPQDVYLQAEQCLIRSKQIHYPEGTIICLMILSRCAWHLNKFKPGLRHAREALTAQNQLDNDDLLAEILHLHALHYWGEGKYYTSQQYWIHALEQSALEDEVEIEIECLLGLGNIWRANHEYKLACSTHELAVKVANNTRLARLEGRARILWAWDLYLLNNYAEMLSVLDGAMEQFEDTNDIQLRAEVWDFRALALIGLERLEDAELAAEQAHNIALENDLSWVRSHSYICRARLELLRGNIDIAAKLLESAEQLADSANDGELLSMIYYQQSVVFEQKEQYQVALDAFKKYRDLSIQLLKDQNTRESRDKAHTSRRQLEQRARKLINRLRSQYEYDPEKHLSNVVSETYWWEQMVLFKTQLKSAKHAVVVIHHEHPKYIDICTELMHSLCTPHDLVSRLSSERLGLLLADKDEAAHSIYVTIQKMIEIYPWERQGLYDGIPTVILSDILMFPFTLEQLEQQTLEEDKN